MIKAVKTGKSDLYTELYTLSTDFNACENGLRTERLFCELLPKNEICRKMSKF